MPNMEELISRISRKIADGPADEIWTSQLDLDYAYGQLILSKEAQNLCIFAVTGGDFTGYYRFLKGFYRLADIPTILQEKIDQTLENKHPAWLDDIIIVTKGSKEQHKKELIEVLTRLENAGYRLSGNKSEFFKSEIEWIGHKIDQNGIRPLQDKLMAIKKSETTQTTQQRKRIKITSGSHPISIQVHKQSLRPNRQVETVIKERQRIDMDGRTYSSIRKSQAKNHGNTVSGSLQFGLPKHNNNRRQYKRPRRNTLARTTRRKFKTNRFRKSISLRHRKEIRNQ